MNYIPISNLRRSARAAAAPGPVFRFSFSTLDGFRESRSFKTLKGAKAYFDRRMGTSFDVSGLGYAVDMFGTGKLYLSGASWTDLLGYNPLGD